MDWSTLITAILTSTALSSAISSFMDNRASRNQAREERHTSNVDAARESLSDLRSAYQRRVSLDELIPLENKFDAAMGKCDSASIWEAAKRYRDIGRRYSSGDPDVSKAAEEQASDDLQSSMNGRTRRYRPD